LQKLYSILHTLYSKIIDFIFPPACPVCGARVIDDGQLCAECWGHFHWISAPLCKTCGYPFPANIDRDADLMCPTCAAGGAEVDWMRAACVYDDVSKNIMLPFKHAAKTFYSKSMSRAMISALRDAPEFDVILPVPLARRRLFKRGYNQAGILARAIAGHFDRPIDYNSFSRKHRPSMGKMSKSQRQENIRGALKIVAPDAFRGKRVLLVDDVFTHGVTFSEMNRLLKKAGAVAVYGIVFCRVVRAI
jgi:ComF family protein